MDEAKKFVVIHNHLGDEWLIGVYDDYEKAYGAILLDCLHELDSLNGELKYNEKQCEMVLSSRIDNFGGYYMEIIAKFSATRNNSEIEVYYRVFFDRESVNGQGEDSESL